MSAAAAINFTANASFACGGNAAAARTNSCTINNLSPDEFTPGTT